MFVSKKWICIISLLVICVLVSVCVFMKLSVNSKGGEYNLYAVNGTLPTLIIGMDLVTNNETPGFLWYARKGTFDEEQLSKYMPNVLLSKNIGNYESLFTDLPNEMKQYVKNVLKKDPNAHFNLIVDEYRNWLEFPVLLELGLNDNQYSIKYYSDGTLSYVAEYEILKHDKYDFFKKERDYYFELIKSVHDGLYQCDKKCYYLINDKVLNPKGLMDYEYDSNYILLSTLRDNVEYYLQYPELIEFKDKEIRAEMEDANIKKLVVREKFNALTVEQKEIFFKLIGLDKQTFDEKYFNSSENKYLIITGANPFYGKFNASKFYEVIDSIVSKYGKEYKILYKPHPATLPNENITSILNSKNIDILPGKMPMEAITFVYDNLKLGGFPSSLYMNISASDTLFFFADSKENLVSPLNILYDQLFYNAELIS